MFLHPVHLSTSEAETHPQTKYMLVLIDTIRPFGRKLMRVNSSLSYTIGGYTFTGRSC